MGGVATGLKPLEYFKEEKVIEIYCSALSKVLDIKLFLFCLQDSSFHREYDVAEEILGEGTFSTCRRCVHRKSGLEYAVKIISRR